MNTLIEQQRAAFALNKVQEIINKQKNDENKNFKAYAQNLPALIQKNGLGQALALALSKSSKQSTQTWKALYDLLETWLCSSDKDRNMPYTGQKNLMQAITTSDIKTYLFAQAEAQALLLWVKKFARAQIPSED